MQIDRKKMSSVLLFLLNIILIVGLIMTIKVYYHTFWRSNYYLSTINNIIVDLLLTICIISTFLIVFQLKNIVRTLVKGNPFVWVNVKALNKISIECFLISSCYLIKILVNIGKSSYRFIYIDKQWIHTDTEPVIFLLAGMFILILATVFKEENDYTI